MGWTYGGMVTNSTMQYRGTSLTEGLVDPQELTILFYQVAWAATYMYSPQKCVEILQKCSF